MVCIEKSLESLFIWDQFQAGNLTKRISFQAEPQVLGVIL